LNELTTSDFGNRRLGLRLENHFAGAGKLIEIGAVVVLSCKIDYAFLSYRDAGNFRQPLNSLATFW